MREQETEVSWSKEEGQDQFMMQQAVEAAIRRGPTGPLPPIAGSEPEPEGDWHGAGIRGRIQRGIGKAGEVSHVGTNSSQERRTDAES